ncbi:chromatin assembly factor 1 subunit A-domain-containing protein [Podospora didyma]|uniref:Chromatin assembly factor 1 subunit A-domain-containing protein n=1 Tax=Podospora didyma TaxID=330526 RepID=A0AAE0NCL7_9PEZI|nr:chromatin assembly factor 1 subunit A-domain-containing protein [Podospora didyma]
MPRFITPQEPETSARKRSHEDFMHQESDDPACFGVTGRGHDDISLSDKENGTATKVLSVVASPVKCNPDARDATSSPLTSPSPSPPPTSTSIPTRTQTQTTLAFTKAPASASTGLRLKAPPAATKGSKPAPKSSATEPPSKKKKLTEEELKAKAKADEERRQERENKKREKEEADKRKLEEKAAKEKEKAAKAEEKATKEKERAAKAEEKAEKDAVKKRLAEEREKKKREKEEEEAKKAKSQLKLTNMFTKTLSLTPGKEKPKIKAEDVDDSSPAGTPSKTKPNDVSLYEKMFKPFFLKDNVTLARNPFEMDEETKEAKAKILDEYTDGKRGEFILEPFNPLEALQIPYRLPRGRVYPSVRKIMAEYHGESSSKPIDLTTESQNARFRSTREALKLVPVKTLKFREDVRPPYIGTITGLPSGVASLRKLAKNPLAKDLLPLDYDYDSEAEWQEEDGEDIEDMDDDEDDGDNDEDMDDFLDDSNDVGPGRLAFSGGMEPESTGLCWENGKRYNEPAKLFKYRMEFILESLDHHLGIDPFSTEYWGKPKSQKGKGNESSTTSASASAPVPASKAGANSSSKTASKAASKAAPAAPRLPGTSKYTSTSPANPMAPPPAPKDVFQALTEGNTAKKPALSEEAEQELREMLISNPKLSKVGCIEFFSANHPQFSKPMIKASFENLTITGQKGKMWKIKGT